ALGDLTGIAICTDDADQLAPRVASSPDGRSLIVWQDRRGGGFDVYAALLDGATGNLLASDVVISAAAGDQVSPRVAYDTVAKAFLVVWSDGRASGGADVYGARVSRDG